MAQFVLVHGAWQGAWVWQAVSAGLRIHGHQVTEVELPGSGSDHTKVAKVTLDAYALQIQAAVEMASEPVYLVGHSMGGIAISAAAEKVFTGIRRLVYLAAFLPRDGDTLMALTGLYESGETPPLELNAQQTTARFAEVAVIPAFLHDAAPVVATWAAKQFRPQALAPLATPVHLSQVAYGSIPRDYILCENDRAIDPRLQQLMIDRSPCAKVYTLKAGHCPFFSIPMELVQLLHTISTE